MRGRVELAVSLVAISVLACSEDASRGATSAGGSSATGGADTSTGQGGTDQPMPCALVENDACLTVTRLEAGGLHSCAALSDGSIRCWGSNDYGQLGDPDFHEPFSSQPRIVPGITGAVDFALGYEHSCALLEGGEVWCWGRNVMGQIGIGATSPEVVDPTRVFDGGVIDIDAEFTHSCAVRPGGEVWCWGFALDGQGWQGGPEDGTAQPIPAPVPGFESESAIGQVASGGSHACAANDAMTRVWCWGNNSYGRLGDGTTNDSAAAVRVGGADAPDQPTAALTTASDHSCTLDPDRHRIWCWGSLTWADPPTSQLLPDVLVEATEPVVSMSSGWRHTCILLETGAVECWGANNQLQLGVPNADQPYSQPVAVEDLPSAEVLSAGRNHACVIAEDGTVWCWGRNDDGQLGGGFASAGPSGPVPVAW